MWNQRHFIQAPIQRNYFYGVFENDLVFALVSQEKMNLVLPNKLLHKHSHVVTIPLSIQHLKDTNYTHLYTF